jgi:hypothetical protein
MRRGLGMILAACPCLVAFGNLGPHGPDVCPRGHAHENWQIDSCIICYLCFRKSDRCFRQWLRPSDPFLDGMTMTWSMFILRTINPGPDILHEFVVG